jgi:putative two-component system response regulator
MNPLVQRDPTSIGLDPAAAPAPPPVRALVVDDDPSLRRLVMRRLTRDGLECTSASSGAEAVRFLDEQGFDVVVTDISMPGMTGLELVRRAKNRDPLLQVILMTGRTEVEIAVEAIRLDADDYLLKPFELEQLSLSVRRALAHRRLVLENQAYRLNLESRVQEQSQRLESLYLSGVRALVAALEAKDPYTYGHSERVTEFSGCIARRLGGVDLHALDIGTQLHDIGKIGTRDAVLSKPAALSATEYEHIREHPLIGVRILAPILDDPGILSVVRHHHERWDGRGYPDGLAGESIPMVARIASVADALDAITSPRPYRPARSWQSALGEIAACRGTQFDPAVVDAALSSLREPPSQTRTF